MPMKKKRHPMQMTKSGDLFAVEIYPAVWGYCRAWRSTGIEIGPVFTRIPGIPDTQWAPATPPKWLTRINLFTKDIDRPKIIPVGSVPFDSEEDAVFPPTWREPDSSEPRYTIEERGIYRYTTNPADLEGIMKDEALFPKDLERFLREKYEQGELQEVAVKALE